MSKTTSSGICTKCDLWWPSEVPACPSCLQAENDRLREELKDARDTVGVELVFDKIAELCGCPEWEYPGQIVRDVEAMRDHRDRLEFDATLLQAELRRCVKELDRAGLEQATEIAAKVLADKRVVQLTGALKEVLAVDRSSVRKPTAGQLSIILQRYNLGGM